MVLHGSFWAWGRLGIWPDIDYGIRIDFFRKSPEPFIGFCLEAPNYDDANSNSTPLRRLSSIFSIIAIVNEKVAGQCDRKKKDWVHI